MNLDKLKFLLQRVADSEDSSDPSRYEACNLLPELLAVVKAAESAADKCDLRILFGPLRVLETKLKDV